MFALWKTASGVFAPATPARRIPECDLSAAPHHHQKQSGEHTIPRLSRFPEGSPHPQRLPGALP